MINFLNISVLKAAQFLLCILFLQSSALAEIRYVSKTGTSIPPYTSWLTAADSIQKCVNICQFGDTIYVGNGVYKEKVVMIDGLSLIGMGTDSCVIDMVALSPSQPHAIEMSDSCLVTGFQIIFAENIQPNGVAIYMMDSSKGNIIYDNFIKYAFKGVGITEGIIRHNYFYKTYVPFRGAVNDFSHQYIANIDSNYVSFYYTAIQVLEETVLKVIGNVFKIESLLYTDGKILSNSLSGSSTPIFSNNIIVKPTYDIVFNSAIANSYPGNFTNNIFLARYQNVFNTYPSTIKNNIVVGSQNAGYIAGSTVKYNNFWNVNTYPNDSTNISVYPLFVNDTSDYHLQMYSPMIDAGDPTILDKDGSRSDIGAYGGPNGESYIYQDLPPRTPLNFYAGMYGEFIVLSWNKNIEPDFQSYRVYRDTIAGTQNLIAELKDTFYTDQIPSSANKLYYKVTAVDRQGNESKPTPEIIFFLSGVDEKHLLMDDYILYQNYPNPFNPSTKIGYKLNKSGYVKLYVYDLTGSEVSVLVNEAKEPGYYETEFNAGNLASGIYLYKIQVTDTEKKIPVFTEIKRVVLVK